MKLIEHTNTIERIGQVTHENTFKMKSSRKAFQILSDLYSDKPLAIVRELGCNAADSHVVAGQTKPFHIHLPNSLEPWLTIQDFGTGITHDNIFNIYTIYFESTKTNSNDQVGCLGLGSKSPFCYTDSFTITTITGSEQRTYNAYFNEQSTPAISLMGKSHTNESTGLTIQIPVKQKDFDSFAGAVKKAFRFFDVKPTISGGKIDWTLEEPIFQGKGWKSYDKLGYNECFAIMGGVTYPIEIGKLDRSHYGMAQKGGLVLYFDMGQVDFTPSRESLSYCDSTIKALNEKFEFVKEDFARNMTKMLEDKTNIFDAIKFVYTLQNKYAHIDGLTLKGKVLWKGVDVSDPIALIRNIIKKNDVNNHCMTYHKTSYYKQRVSESGNPSLERDVKWVYDDLARGGLTRIKAWCRENEEKKMTLFSEGSYKNLIKAGFSKDLFEPVSSLPKPIPAARKKKMVNGVVPPKIKGSYNIYEMGDITNVSWEGREIDPAIVKDADIPKYYLVKGDTWKFNLNIKGIKEDIDDKHKLSNIIRFMGLTDDDVIMVSDRNVKRLPKKSVEFSKWVVDNIDLTFDKQEMTDCLTYSNAVFNNLQKHTLFDTLHEESAFKQYVNYICECHRKYQKFKDHMRSLLSLWDNANKKPSCVKSDNKVLQVIVSKAGSYQWETDLIMNIVASMKKDVDTLKK
jgi:hypothetical protein